VLLHVLSELCRVADRIIGVRRVIFIA